MVLAAAGSMGMPSNHDSYTPAASSNRPDFQHAPAASNDSALDPLPWLVIESGQEHNHDNGWAGVNSSPLPREPNQPLRPAEPIAAPTKPGVPFVRSQLTSPADQHQGSNASQDASPKEQQTRQSDMVHQAEQPAPHAVVYGPMPEGVQGPMQLQQVLKHRWSTVQMQPYTPMLSVARGL